MVRCANLRCVLWYDFMRSVHQSDPLPLSHLHEIMVVKRKGTMGLKALSSWGSRRQNDIQKEELLGAANYMVEVVLPTSTKGNTQIYFQTFNEDNICQVITDKPMENEETLALSGHRNRKTDDSATERQMIPCAFLEAQDSSQDYSIYNYSTASYEEATWIPSVDFQRKANQSRDDNDDDDFSLKTLLEEEYQSIMARDEPLAQNEGHVDNFLVKGMVVEVPHARADERSSIHAVNDGGDASNNAGEAREDPEESTLTLDSVERNSTSSAPETMLDDGDGVAARSSVSKWRPFKSIRKIKEPEDVAKVGVLPDYVNLRNDAASASPSPTGPKETHILADGKAAVDHEVAAKEDDNDEQAEESAQRSALIVPPAVNKGVKIQDHNALVDQLDEDSSCLTHNSLSTATRRMRPNMFRFWKKPKSNSPAFENIDEEEKTSIVGSHTIKATDVISTNTAPNEKISAEMTLQESRKKRWKHKFGFWWKDNPGVPKTDLSLRAKLSVPSSVNVNDETKQPEEWWLTEMLYGGAWCGCNVCGGATAQYNARKGDEESVFF